MAGSLDELRNWKLEAKFEDMQRYFYEFAAVERLFDGTRYCVIGRKGTGKTAISEHIRKIQRHDVFSEKLTFKNFPFNELYARQNTNYTMPNQYITLWKFIIYSFVCRLMAKNAGIDPSITVLLNELYAADAKTNLQRMIQRWTTSEFSFSALGSGAKISKTKVTNPSSWIEKCDVLEDIISAYCDKCTYYIVFDELDEDYKDMVENYSKSEYLSLISLLKSNDPEFVLRVLFHFSVIGNVPKQKLVQFFRFSNKELDLMLTRLLRFTGDFSNRFRLCSKRKVARRSAPYLRVLKPI